MKKLNLPLLLILVFGSIGLLTGIYLLHGYQKNRIADNLALRAEQAQKDEDLSEEVRLLSRYLRHRPKDVEKFKQLLTVSKEAFEATPSDPGLRKLFFGLYKPLQRAIIEHPEDPRLRRDASQFALGIHAGTDVDKEHYLKEAMDHLEQLESMGELTSKDQVALAKCKLAMNDRTMAIEKLSELIGFDPADNTIDVTKATDAKATEAYVLLAGIYRDQGVSVGEGDAKIPDLIMDQMIEENSESPDAYLSRAAFRYSDTDDEDRKEKAMSDINTAIELDPESERLTIAAAQLCMETKDSAKAQSLLESGVARLQSSNDTVEPGTAKYGLARRMYSLLASIAEEEGDLERSKNYIDRGLEQLKLDPELMFLRANFEIDLDEIEAARQTLARLEQQVGPRAHSAPMLEILRARLLIVADEYAAAARVLEKQRSLLSQDRRFASYVRDIDGYLITCYQQTGQLHLVRQIQERQGNTVLSDIDRAVELVRQQRFAEAIDLYEGLSKQDGLTALGKQMIFERVLDARIQEQLARPEEQRDWTIVHRMEASILSQGGLSETEKEVFGVNQLARRGEVAEARKRVERLVQENSENKNYWMLLNKLQADHEIGMRILDQIEQRFGDSVTLRLARARRILQSGGDDVSTRLQQLEQDADQFSFQDQADLWSGLANAYATAEVYDKAIATVRRLQQLNPENASIVNAISVWAYESGNLPVMEEMLVAVEQLIGKETSQWRLAEGRRLLWQFKQGQGDKGTLNEVRHLIDRILKEQPNYPPAQAVQAELFVLEEDFEGATEALKNAVAKSPQTPQYKRKLIDILMQRGLYGDANYLLSRLDDSIKRPVDRMFEIRVLVNTDPAAALEKARQLIPADSKDVQRLALLAEVQQLAGKPEEALATLKQAVAVQPDNHVAWGKYIQLLIQQGKKDEAETVIGQMQTQIAEKDLPRLLGQCQAMLGNLDQAREIYDQAIQAEPSNTQLLRDACTLASAQKDQGRVNSLLDQIIALDRKDADLQTAGDAVWARRTRAQILASSGSYKDFLEALRLLEQNAGGERQLEGPDLLLWLRYCSNRPESASRQRAVTRLSEIQNRRRLTDNEKVVLAHLYKTSGRWNDAQQIMVDLLTANSDNENLMSTYIQWLLERDELVEAAAWTRKLDPASTNAIRFRSVLEVRQGKEREAAARLMALVPKELTAERAGNVQKVAVICEELGQYNPKFYTLAEQQWLRYAKLRPDDIASVIGFYLRVPKGEKLDKGFTICEKQMSKALQEKKPEVVLGYIGICLDALSNHKKDLPEDSPLYDRVSKWFDVARKANVSELHLTSKEMYFYNIRSNFARLEELYRDFLTRDDVDDLQKATIRNNLAFLLAVTDRGNDALQVIGDAIQQLGPQAALLDTRAMAYLSSGQLETAIKDLQAIVAGGDATPGIYFHLALAQYRNNNITGAVEALLKAQSMGLTEADLEPPEVPIYRQLLSDLGPELKKQESDLELSSR